MTDKEIINELQTQLEWWQDKVAECREDLHKAERMVSVTATMIKRIEQS